MEFDINIKDLASRIWRACASVRVLMSESQLQQIMMTFTFIRRIDCLVGKYAEESHIFYLKNKDSMDEEKLHSKLCDISGGYPFYNTSGYNFNDILTSGISLETTLNSYLQGFSTNVLEFLNEMNYKQNLSILNRKPRILVSIFDFYSELDLSNSNIDNDEYVELISSLIPDLGQNYTPQYLSTLICDCLFADDVRKTEDEYITIYDPVCGTGCMLSSAVERAKNYAVHQSNISLYGQEISLFPCAIAKGLAMLTGNCESKILYGNTLIEDLFPHKHFQYILADIPFGLQWKQYKDIIEKESLDERGRFFIGLPSTSDCQFLFIEHILSKMDKNGSRAAFITSGSALYGGTAQSGESRIRRWLFEHDLVETIIALPSGILGTTNVPVYLWILSNKKYDTQVDIVHLIDATKLEKKEPRSIAKSRLQFLREPNFGFSDSFIKSIIKEYKTYKETPASKFIMNKDFGFYEVDLIEKGKKKETVNISLDTDIHEFVKKERQPFTNEEITIDYSSVEKGYAIQFEKFFKKEAPQIPSLKDTSLSVLSTIESIDSLQSDIEKLLKQKVDENYRITWTEIPLVSATEIIMGISRENNPNDNGLPLLSVPYLRKGTNDEILYEVTPKHRCSTEMDAIIVAKGANTGEVFKGVDGILTPSIVAIRCIDESVIAPQFLYYLIKGNEKSLMALAKGVSIKSLDSQALNNFKCLLPPLEEQIIIADYLNDIVGKLDNVIRKLNSADTIFSKYRQILIENIVKGLWKIPHK